MTKRLYKGNLLVLVTIHITPYDPSRWWDVKHRHKISEVLEPAQFI